AGHAPLIEESGAGRLIRRAGCLYLYKAPEQFAEAQKEMTLRESQGVRMEVLDSSAIRDAEPNLAPLYYKAIRFLDCYHFDTPHRYALALAETIHRRGGRFVQGDAVRLIREEEEVGILAEGDVIKADRIVVACGAWSKSLAASIGDRIL